MKTLVLGFLAVALVGTLLIGGAGCSTYNNLATLHVTYDMKVKANKAEFDNMWKKIKEVAQVPEQKKEALVAVLNAYTSGRSAGQSQLMTWVKEAVPSTSGLDIYDKIVNIVTGSRDTWTSKQTELVAVAEDYNKIVVKFPGSLIAGLFHFDRIEPQVITSTRTEESFTSGKDDDVGLFPKK